MAIELSSTEKEKGLPIVNFVFTLSLLVLIISLAIFAYFYFIVSKDQETQKHVIENQNTQQQIEGGYTEESLAKISKQIEDYKKIVQERAKSSSFFSHFQDWVHPQIYFTSFNLDVASRSATLSGVASGFQPLIQQIAIFKNEALIEKYEISNITMADTGGVTFSLSLIVKPEVLK